VGVGVGGALCDVLEEVGDEYIEVVRGRRGWFGAELWVCGGATSVPACSSTFVIGQTNSHVHRWLLKGRFTGGGSVRSSAAVSEAMVESSGACASVRSPDLIDDGAKGEVVCGCVG